MDFEPEGKKIDLSNLESQDLWTSVRFEEPRKTQEGEATSSRLEQTVAGMAIGSVRDLFSEPQSIEEKAERAQSNDFMAEVAADVMVMLPRFKMAKAGLARTALLANPHEGLGQSPTSLAGNFFEGAALNKISRSMLPGSKLNGFTARHLGTGLKAEAATHLSAGFGFGAVKAGFDENSWKDESGNFSLASGAESILKTGTTASLLNLPAGIVGMRAAHLTAVGTKSLSPRAQSILIGSTSGYTSGALVGGIEAVKEGKSLGESLSLMNQSGLIGLGTGAAFMSTMRMEQSASLINRHANRGKSELLPGLDRSNTRAGRPDLEASMESVLASNAEARTLVPGKSRRFEVSDDVQPTADKSNPLEALEFHKRTDLDLPLLTRRLKAEGQVTEVTHHMPERLKGKSFDTVDEYNASLVSKQEAFTAYRVEGHDAPLLVNESQMPAINRIRNLRRLAEKSTAYDRLPHDQKTEVFHSGVYKDAGGKTVITGPKKEAMMKYMSKADAEESLAVLSARTALRKDPNGAMALPEDIVAVMDELPNPKLVKKVVVHDSEYSMDGWIRSSYDPEFTAAATASKKGEISFYKPRIDLHPNDAGVNIDGSVISRAGIRSVGNHEWAHLANFSDKHTDGLYKLAKAVDLDVPEVDSAPRLNRDGSREPAGSGTDKYFARTYARRDISEDWAVHMGEEFMSPELADFQMLAESAPVRTTILYQNMLRNVVHSKQSNVFGRSIYRRMQYVENEVFPEAWKILENRVASGNLNERAASVELLGHIGNPKKHSSMLMDIAADPKSTTVKDLVPKVSEGQISYLDPAGRRTLADTAFDAAMRLAGAGRNGESELAFLVRQVNTGSGQVKEMAMTRLAQHNGGNDLIRFANLKGDPDNLDQLMVLMDGMTNVKGQHMIFDEVLALGSQGDFGAEFVSSMLIKTADRNPTLRLKAVTEFGRLAVKEPISGSESFFLRHSMSRDRLVADRANKVLHTLKEQAKVADTHKLLDQKGTLARQEGLIMAVGLSDNSLIEPVLRIYALGTQREAGLAAQALSKHSPQMLKYYANRLRSEGIDLSQADLAKLRATL